MATAICRYPRRLRAGECRLILQHAVVVRNSRDEERGIIISSIDTAATRRQGGACDLDLSTAVLKTRGLTGVSCQLAVGICNTLKQDGGIIISSIDTAATRRQGGTRDRDISTASRIAAGLGMRCRQSTEN
jgi:hypothetical protein